MSITEIEQPAALPRIPRRWFRFSLRSLFVLVTAVAVLVVSYGSIKRWVTKDAISPALIRLRVHSPQVLPEPAQGIPSEREFELYRETQMALIRSNFVLQAALRRPTIAGTPIVKQHKADAVSWLQEHLEVKNLEDTEIVQISFADGSALERVAITNAIKDSYMDEIVNGERMERLRERQMVEKTYAKYSEQLRAKLEQFQKRKSQSGDDSLSPLAEMLQLEIDLLRDHLKQIGSRLHTSAINVDSQPRVISIEDATVR